MTVALRQRIVDRDVAGGPPRLSLWPGCRLTARSTSWRALQRPSVNRGADIPTVSRQADGGQDRGGSLLAGVIGQAGRSGKSGACRHELMGAGSLDADVEHVHRR